MSERIIKILVLFSVVTASLPAQNLRGVNLAGAEFGDNRIPGVLNTDYTYNSELTFQYFAAKSLGLTRVAVRWERLQPVLSGPLDPGNLAALKRDVAWAATHGNRVIIDVHNYGRYKINAGRTLQEYVIDNKYGGAVPVSSADFANLWVRLSTEFQFDAAVYAYGLMNEPHDMGAADWKSISQAAVNAIRNNGDTKLIMVPGNSWAAAYIWAAVNGPTSWIIDPANNFAYEAHQYFDSDNSGTYKLSYDEELNRNPGLATLGPTRLAPFIQWCRNNSVRGYLGEYGVPDNDQRWLTVLDHFLSALDDAGFDGTYWAAGEWWGSYALSVQPQSNYTIDRPQLAILQRHLSPGAFTTVSAASSSGIAFAPDSLVTGYGAGLDRVTRLELTDSSGMKTPANLLFVSPDQINYLVPAGLALGRANVSAFDGDQTIGAGVLWLERVAPSLFSANSDGRGIAAAQIVRVRADGTLAYEPVTQFDSAQNQFVAAPITFGNPSERIFLVLYGTGWRNVLGPDAVSLQIGSVTLGPVAYAGRQPDFAGLDQLNAELPRSLSGAGEVAVVLKVEGKAANQVTVAFR